MFAIFWFENSCPFVNSNCSLMACLSLLQSVCQPGGTGGAGGGGHEALRNNITLQTVTALSPLEPKTYRLIPREDDYRKTRSLHVSYFAKTTAQNNQENRQINRDFAIDLNPLTNASIDLRDNRKAHQTMQTNQTSLGLRTPAHNRTSTQVPTRSQRRPRPKRKYQH